MQKGKPQEIQQDSEALIAAGANIARKHPDFRSCGLEENMAGADENRTHRGRDTPPNGFEDRERHQTTNYSRR